MEKQNKFKQYIWDKMIAPQLGYSFNLAHGVSYSLIAVQEMNLATRWNSLYWACACLCVNAGNSDTCFSAEDEDDDEEDIEIIEEEEESEAEVKEKKVAPNYGKIAKAITDAQHAGVKIELPYINEAQEDFVPDIENNAILYSLKAVNVVNPELFDKIVANRPFTSISDFIAKVDPSTVQMIGLIKAGCFDKIYSNKGRRQIMTEYLQLLANKNVLKKDKITATQLRQAVELKMNLSDYKELIRLAKYKKYLDKKQVSPEYKNSYLLNDEDCLRYFHIFVEKKLSISKGDYQYISPNEIVVRTCAFKKFYDAEMKPLMDYLNSEEGLEEFYNVQQAAFIRELDEKYCSSSIAAWEMETVNFYHEPHELSRVDRFKYGIKNFNELPEIPVARVETKGDKTFTLYDISAVAGTVIKADNTRKIVTLITLDGVVDVKFYATNYIQFSKKISVIDKSTGKKTTIDDSWFKRGSKILVYGYRRENTFIAKNERESGFRRIVCKINDVFETGSLDMEFTRKKVTKDGEIK